MLASFLAPDPPLQLSAPAHHVSPTPAVGVDDKERLEKKGVKKCLPAVAVQYLGHKECK